MNRIRKWWKPILAVVLGAVALQLGVSLLVRTARVRSFLTRQLQSAFGRPVEVREFSASIFPAPQVDAYAISVGEDPAFGNEYFLRADRLSASLRWRGLVRGRFELGTLQLDRPSLILVRSDAGQWNLERWLPQAKTSTLSSSAAVSSPPTHHLRKIEISNGRVNFKIGQEKTSFAFQQVEGAIEQTASGRWRLNVRAEPWRSGIPLQLAGTVRVSGEVAGTSVRLRPAHLRATWAKSSLADVFRLIAGGDFGVRGAFAGEASVDSDESSLPETKDDALGDWAFNVHARATDVHRWDLAERDDNPRVSFRMKGRWNPALGTTEAHEVSIETPRSNIRGTATLQSLASLNFEVRMDSAGLQAADFLDWYRAFQPGVSEEIEASQYFTGTAVLRGWPLRLEEAAFSSPGGRWMLPGFASALSVRSLRGGTQRGKLLIEPFMINVPARKLAAGAKGTPATARNASVSTNSGSITVSLQDDVEQHAGSVSIEGQLQQLEAALAAASAFGHELRRGWDLTGKAAGDLRWEWDSAGHASWTGHADLTRGSLRVAGLNQPLQLESVRAEWRDKRRKFTIGNLGAFGATWSGTVAQAPPNGTERDDNTAPQWEFQLQADQLDAAELDRWIGPRARPSWIERLLPAALGGSAQSSPASAVLKGIRAEGDLRVEQVEIEKISLKGFRADAALNGLKLKLDNAQAQWSGGFVTQGHLAATLSGNPTYDVSALFSHVTVTQTPWLAHLADRLAGAASGKLELQAKGIGREALLKSLNGKGELRLEKIELRGWDLAGTMARGEWKPGISRWPSGTGTFHISDGGFELNAMRLASPSDEFLLKGSVSFSQDTDLTAESHVTGRNARPETAIRFLTISGPLTEPKVSLERTTAQQPGD